MPGPHGQFGVSWNMIHFPTMKYLAFHFVWSRSPATCSCGEIKELKVLDWIKTQWYQLVDEAVWGKLMNRWILVNGYGFTLSHSKELCIGARICSANSSHNSEKLKMAYNPIWLVRPKTGADLWGHPHISGGWTLLEISQGRGRPGKVSLDRESDVNILNS